MSLNSLSGLTKGSFFDDDANLSKFEFSTADGFEIISEPNYPPGIKGILFCKNPDAKDIKCGTFALYSQYLVYFKDECDNRPEGILNIMHATIKCLSPCDQEMASGFALTKEGRKYEFYSKDKQVIDNWIFELKNVCVLTDFYESFKVHKLLGKGSFAKVYLAEYNSNKKLFAVKSFRKDAIATANRKRSLINEIEILRTLDHDNIVKLHQIYETEHSVFLILDYVDGKTLEDSINQSTFKTNTYDIKVFNIIQSLLDVLAYLASKGIMHRDLKPGNILLEKGEKVKVFDFGISTCINVNQYIFNKCGTPGYIAPEVFGFDPKNCSTRYNDRCDVFSSGCIFFYLLFGKLLFEAPDDSEVMQLNRSFNCGTNVLKFIQSKYKSKFETVPKEAIDLLLKLVEANHYKRISAEQALKHPYFTPFPMGMNRVDCSNKHVCKPLPKATSKQDSPKFTLDELKAKRLSAKNSIKLQARLAFLEKEKPLLATAIPEVEEKEEGQKTPPAAIFKRESRPIQTMDLLGVPELGKITRHRSHSFDDTTEQNPGASVPNVVVMEKLQKIQEFDIEEFEENGLIDFMSPLLRKNSTLHKERRGSGSTVEESPCTLLNDSPENEAKERKPKRRFNVFGGRKETVKGAV